MSTKFAALIFCGLIAVSELPALAAPVCDVKATVPATARTYAKTGDQETWREFKSVQDVPPLDSNGGV